MNIAPPQKDLIGPNDPPLSEVLRCKIAELSFCLEHNHSSPSPFSQPSSHQHHLSDLLDSQFKTITILLLNQLDISSLLSIHPQTAEKIGSRSQVHINPDSLERLLRYAASLNVVNEVNKNGKPAFLKTSVTELLASNPLDNDQVSFFCQSSPIYERLLELLLFNEIEETEIKPTKDHNGLKRVQKYLKSIKIMTLQEHLFPLINSLVKNSMGTTLVDISGGSGDCMFNLKKYSRNIHCIVFDSSQEVEGYTASADVEFVAGDILNEEEIPQADIFLLRSVLQKYSDQHCSRLLSNLFERLNPGGLLINMSQHIPNYGQVTEKDGGSMCMDLRLMAMGVRERARVESDLKMLVQQSGFLIGARHIWNMDYGGRVNCMIAYKQSTFEI